MIQLKDGSKFLKGGMKEMTIEGKTFDVQGGMAKRWVNSEGTKIAYLFDNECLTHDITQQEKEEVKKFDNMAKRIGSPKKAYEVKTEGWKIR